MLFTCPSDWWHYPPLVRRYGAFLLLSSVSVSKLCPWHWPNDSRCKRQAGAWKQLAQQRLGLYLQLEPWGHTELTGPSFLEVERLESQCTWETPSWTILSSYTENPQDDESHFCGPCQVQQSDPVQLDPNCHLTRNIHFFQLMYYEVDGQERITHLPTFPFKLYFWLVKYYNEVIFLLNL